MIDWHRVGELRGSLGEAEFPDVAEMYLSDLAEATGRLAGGVPPETLALELNDIATGALNLGLAELAELASEGRDLAIAGRAGRLDPLLILRVFQDSRSCFLAATSGPPALRLVG